MVLSYESEDEEQEQVRRIIVLSYEMEDEEQRVRRILF